MTMALKLFVDFDGTVTTTDVGDAFFLEFGGAECTRIVQEYRRGTLSARDCFDAEAAAVGRLDLRAAEAFVDAQTIDPGFGAFVGFCRDSGIDVTVVSDGLDYYIRRILARHGLRDVSFFSNRLELSPVNANGEAKIAVSYPFIDAECNRCACCKRNIILTNAGEQDIIGYIGEGYSDRCAAQYADIVFAKDELEIFCQKENISYFTYRTFEDVVSRLKQLLAKKRLRKRRQAELRRREVFMQEP